MTEEKKHHAEISLCKLLAPERIMILKGKQTKTEVFAKLIDCLCRENPDLDRDAVEWGIENRENLMSTGIGGGIAMPHVLLPNVGSTQTALAICSGGIPDYQTPDNRPVHLVFMLISGKDQKLIHLKVLASIGSLFYDGRLKAAFLAANDPQTCMEILARTEK